MTISLLGHPVGSKTGLGHAAEILYAALEKSHAVVLPKAKDALSCLSHSDIVITIGDLWSFEKIADYKESHKIIWIAYTGCEGIKYPNYCRIAANEIIDMRGIGVIPDLVVSFSESGREVFSGIFGAEKTDCINLYSEIEPLVDGEIPDIIKRAFGAFDKKCLFIGDNLLRKGIPELLTLAEAHRDTLFYLHTPYMTQFGVDIIEARQQMRLKNVILKSDIEAKLGSIVNSNDFIRALYSYFDIYIHPHNAEGFGLTVLEALTVAKKQRELLKKSINVYATKTGGVKDFLPANAAVSTDQKTYIQCGGVGYWVEKPLLSEFSKGIMDNNQRIKSFDLPTKEKFESQWNEIVNREYKKYNWKIA